MLGIVLDVYKVYGLPLPSHFYCYAHELTWYMQKGPFTTGLKADGQDTGTGFKVAQIEDNPSAFMADVHSSLAVPGAVRGQLA